MNNAKKKKRDQERALKRQEWAFLNEKIKKEKETGLIPEKVTLIKGLDDSKKYKLSFIHYLDNECEVEKMIKNKDQDLGHALKILKSLSNECSHYSQLKNYNFTVKPVSNGGQYRKLFKGLKNKSVDIKNISIYESYIKDENDGRMFFWSNETKKIIYIITIRKNHYK